MRAFFALVVSPLVLGCAAASNGDVRAHAAEDLHCTEKQLKVEPLDDRTQWVSGCGERLLYTRDCTTTASACDWHLADARARSK